MKKVQIPENPATSTDQYLARIVQQNDTLIRQNEKLLKIFEPFKPEDKKDSEDILKEG